MLEGEPDAAEHLDAGLRDRDGTVEADRPGHQCRELVLHGVVVAGCPRGIPGCGSDRLTDLEHLRAEVLDRLERADLLAELLTQSGVLDGGVDAPAGDPGGLGGGQRHDERSQPLRGEAGDHRRLELGNVTDGGTTGQVRRGARGQVGLLERDQQHLVTANVQSVGGTGGVVNQAAGTQRERHPHLPRRNGTGQLPQRDRCHRRAEQRARHQRTGSRLERDREVQQGATGTAERLGYGDPGQPHLGHRRGLLGELRSRVALRLPGSLDACQ